VADRRLSILVVDDDPGVRELIEDVLDGEGHVVVTANDGKSGLESAHVAIFDVAVVDYSMPAPNGLELLARMRRIQPNCVGVLISGHLDLPAAIEAVNRGEAVRIMTKPFTVRELVNAVNEAVEVRQRVGEQYQWTSAMEHSEEERGLRECFKNNLFAIALQPIVSAKGRKVVAYEALLRCSHPWLSGPASVLAAAERHGRLPQLGAAVIAKVAEALPMIAGDAKLFINLHPEELEDPDGLIGRLKPLAAAAERVVLEITERTKMKNADQWRESTKRAREAGFSLAVDDVGAGYSSLSVLAELKPQYLKIDMSIIRDCDHDDHKRRLIELLCRFGETSSARVIAEGIETTGEAATVSEAGAHMLQGFLLGRPQLASVRDQSTAADG
jgi:EAL domain-containing protein (putative c-di-GMP-specific phosphodiesterase class I)/CheY-like chemotaxis protein